MKNYDSNKESSYLMSWDINNLCRLVISQKSPLGCFEWFEETSCKN